MLALVAASSLPAQGTAPVITRKLTIGCESCGGATQFGSIQDVSISVRGEILVTDRDAPMLRRFDANGNPAWSGGRKGKGPGEFTLPIRSVFTPTGLLVIDMSNSRLTDLGAEGRVIATLPLTSLATTSSANKRGDVIMGLDDLGRSFRVMARPAGATTLREVASLPGSMKNKSVALAGDGRIAVVADGETYEIQRYDAAGTPMTPIARDIPRPRRSAVEEAEYRQRLNRGMAMMSAEMKKQGGDGRIAPLDIPLDQRGLESHVTVDGLRYDDAGRLWVQTMRGDETGTVFDVFSPSGDFLGPVTIPMRINGFALGGEWLVVAGENEDGVPVVTVWLVR
jgi:hypothetical protein